MSLTNRDSRELPFDSVKEMVIHDLRALAVKEEKIRNLEDAEFFDELADYILLEESKQ